ncbi:NACHT domain-containing protein [Dendronalium sp. ChiSLP03b]|uniref:NACHT domain-containing protein n=1 Tax=Dendronalium sp. ChiSLP03b TaxID=3075381 RepID=UPI002AD5943F|nr:NACHT domain-containing protein [Dendronalium sp. ChiSLP03b]MDZ8209343.1 NACHT domain-containing protein [Dendronalium sp. ChiSLP03b]
MTGMEPLVAAVAASAVSGVAVPIFQSLWGGGGKLLGLFGKTLDEKTRELIFTASKQYVQNYEERHGILKVLGMREPVKLESVYTAVQFLDNDARSSFESIENLEQFYRQANTRRFQSQDKGKQEGIKVANDKQYLMVLGSPGAGKSTFLRKMGLEALKGKRGGFQHSCIPVFIELKRFTSSDINIENFIAEEFRICGFPEPNQFTAKALEQGKLLILLDGLDEVPTKNSTNVISHIQDFVDTYDKNRFITSCRVAAYRHNFRRFTDVAMADFDDIQIENFINNWFKSKPDVGKDCWQKLNSQEYTAAKELTQTPLLLTLVCLLYQRSGKIPTNRATLYERALRVLLEEWAGEKGIAQEDLYKGLDTKRKEMILSEIAHDAFQEDRLFLPRREIADKIAKLLAEMLPDEKFINGIDVLKSIEVQHGVLVERADSIYSFSHLTLQEYLTAQYIDDHRHIEKLVTEHLTDERWKEVFLLVAGLMRGGADDLLLSMEKEAQKYINTPKLQALLNWVEQATTGSTGDFKPVGKRTIAMAYAYANASVNTRYYVVANPEANAYANAEAKGIAKSNADANAYALAISKAKSIAKGAGLGILKAKDIAEIKSNAITEAINYIHTLEELTIFNNVNFNMLIDELKEMRTKVTDEEQPQEAYRAFLPRLIKTSLNAFNLSPDIINLSQSETKALENYLYVNSLIIQCKQASVRVSPTTWEAIEARMLLVPSS